MNKKEAYKQKIEAELELAQAKLAEYKARVKSAVADARIQYIKHVEEIEHGLNAAEAKIKELNEAREDKWEHLKEGAENVWERLRCALRDAAAKFKH